MKKSKLLIGSALLLAATMPLSAADEVADSDMGLSKTDVFATPSPQAFSYSERMPGQNEPLPSAFPGAPAQIPHAITAFEPVTLKSNACVVCHDKPMLIGQKIPGVATPMPASHYTDLRRDPETVTKKVIGARFVCTQCHVPQAGVEPLVGSTF